MREGNKSWKARSKVGRVKADLYEVYIGGVGMSHLTVSTKSCGVFIVPVSHLTLHIIGDKCRVLFRDDSEWREITGEEYQRILEFL